ncbi:MAG TPA: hypothetical protein VMP01_25635 [Pirellulaceae bacterium]|nr:hypothetical protein [Pirellulaceae bacterium]
MDKPFRRFEILLPLRYNDGRAVPDDVLADTLLELEQRFGSVSCDFRLDTRLAEMGGDQD